MFVTTKDAEAKLVEMLSGIREEANHWRVIHFHLNELLEEYRSEYQIKIGVNLINDLLKSYQGGIFILRDSTLFVVCRNVTKAQLDKAVFQVRYLFLDDPLAYRQDGQENPAFCSIHDLGVDWEKVFNESKRIMAKISKIPAGMRGKPTPIGKITDTDVLDDDDKPIAKASRFSAQHIAGLEDDIRKSDLTMVLRRQPVCAVGPMMNARRVFDEMYMNIAHLRKLLRTNIDFLSNRWLFKYLTQILDERVIQSLQRNPRFLDTPTSFNFNIETLLSENFAKFDETLKPETKVSMVLELQVADVFDNMVGFRAAREFVQKQGYRICLDGVTPLSFTHINRERLGVDLVKVQWSPELEIDASAPEYQLIKQAVQNCGANRIILCRCDNQSAVEYGQSMGIQLFQGRYLDKLVNPNASIEN